VAPDGPIGLYLHVPYCSAICGYCDFNTYVAAASDDGPRGHVDLLLAELSLAAEHLGRRPSVDTVFVGGGTPTLLGAGELTRLLQGVRQLVDLSPDAEVTTEANPESVDPHDLAELRAGGFTRLSLGMQSASEQSSSGFSSTARQPHSDARRRISAVAFAVIRMAGSVMALCRWSLATTSTSAALPANSTTRDRPVSLSRVGSKPRRNNWAAGSASLAFGSRRQTSLT